MKLNRTYLFIAVSSIALVVVLIIQVNWIVETAKVKEALFNEKANMVLTRVSDALHADTAVCRNMQIHIGPEEIHQIDSLFTYYMKFYNFHIEYSFEVKPAPLVHQIMQDSSRFKTGALYPPSQPECYQKGLEEAASVNGFDLKLVFPGKAQYIREEMGTVFITSVILILVVLVMFWRTTVSLMKEKEISEHTTDFLNNMTHEFKTPLTNIALAGRMLVKDPTIKQEDKIKHYSGIILDENEKLRLQVEQVLSMTALERGEIPLHKTELDVHRLIQACVKSISLQAESRQGTIALSLDAEHVVVMGDKTHLANALCNLLDNALKYSHEKPALSVQTSNEGQHLMIVVSDQGIGIDKDYHRKVFDKFFRVPTGDVHDVKGFGLGLAYVKKIIELHGGSIELESEKGKGTAFTITLPYV